MSITVRLARQPSFLLAFLLCTALSWAQTDRGAIRGTISDPTGAVVAGAVVTATNLANGVSAKGQSTDAGVYNIPALPAGMYRVTVALTGFETEVRDNIIVDVGNVTGLDMDLVLGSSLQTITVKAAPPILKTEQSSTSSEVPVNVFNELPLSAGGGRTPAAFKYLTPGVNGNNSVNGSPQESAQISMDGASMENAETYGGNWYVRFSPEAVSEMSIVTTAYNAEYGQTEGGIQRYTIKSGTNEFHGTLLEFNKNTAFDARGFFNTATPSDHQNEWGVSVGGPVRIPKLYNGTNRSFFFVDLDWYHWLTAGSTNIVSLPNTAFRNGDFSGNLGAAIGVNPCDGSTVYAGQIFDPLTTRTVNGQQCRTAFPRNIIPSSRISPAAIGILAMVPPSTTQAIANNAYLPTAPGFNNFHNYIIKGDQYFGPKHHLSMVWLDSANPTGGGGYLPPPLTYWGGIGQWSWDAARLTHDWVIGPNLLNEFRLAYNREIEPYSPTGAYSDSAWASKLGIPGFSTASGLFPNILWGSYVPLDVEQFWYATSNTYIISDSLAWTKGRHNFKFGEEWNDEWHALWKDWPAQISFGKNETGLPTALGSTGNEISSFLLGYVDTANIPSLANTSVNYRAPYMFDLYAQDDYKVTSRLTLNYGLRWSLYKPFIEMHNIYSAVDLSMPNPSAGNLPGSYVFAGLNGQKRCLSTACISPNRWGPRLGLAYRASNRVVIRSAYGISYFPTGLYGAGNNAYMTDGFDPPPPRILPTTALHPPLPWPRAFP